VTGKETLRWPFGNANGNFCWRIIQTQQKDTAKYLASGETAYQVTETQLFTNLTETEVARISAPGYPNDVSVTNPNNRVFKVKQLKKKLNLQIINSPVL